MELNPQRRTRVPRHPATSLSAIESAAERTAAIAAALETASGDFVAAAVSLGVSRTTLYSWMRTLGIRAKVREKFPGIRERRFSRASERHPATGTVSVQVEHEGAREYVSIVNTAGDLITIGVPAHTELVRLAELINFRRGERRADEQGEIAAEIQVSSAAQRERFKRLEAAVWRVCGPELGRRVMREVEDGKG